MQGDAKQAAHVSSESFGPSSLLRRAAGMALAALGRGESHLRVVWFTEGRAVFLQGEPPPAVFIKVYQHAAQLEREAITMARASARGIPVAPRVAFHTGPPAVLITERVSGIPLSSAHPMAAEATGRLLREFHSLGALPPFVDGQPSWSAFIRGWAEREIVAALEWRAITPDAGRKISRHFTELDSCLNARPCALIHADLQSEHVLIDPVTQRVTALLDFVDTQPGDPLVDIAVLTLWDRGLTIPVLTGYGAAGHEDADLLPSYRLLRHLGAANWLVKHGARPEARRHERAAHQYVHDFL